MRASDTVKRPDHPYGTDFYTDTGVPYYVLMLGVPRQ